MHPLNCHTDVHGDVAVVTLVGELDIATLPYLAARLRPLAGRARHVILDLAELTFCSCGGLTLFLDLQSRTTARGGSLHLVSPTRLVRRLLDLVPAAGTLPVVDAVSSVFDMLGPEPGVVRSPEAAAS